MNKPDEPVPVLPGASLTSADPLLLSGEDSWCVDDADALQHGVGQLGTHEPAWGGRKRAGGC